MKRILYITFLASTLPSSLLAQGVGVNTDGSAPDASAILDLKSTDKGLLVPRVSLTDVTSPSPITSPATGLLVYNTNASVTGGSGTGFYYWDGTQWVRLDVSNGDWRLTGNSGTSPATNYLGTSDATDLSIRTNATERIRVTSSGTVRLNSYTTNNVVKTSGGDGTLTVGSVNLASSEVTGVLPVANGGTGVNVISNNGVMVGNGTSPISTVAPGAAGNVLMSDGTTWTSNDGSGQFIRNQNSADQTANFRITGTGRANTSFQSPVYTRADVGTVSIRPNTNSTTAIQLQNAGGTSILNVDATNNRVGIGTTAPLRPLEVSATGTQQIAAVHPSNVNNSEPAEIVFDRSAVASTQLAAVGMSGTARDFFIWVNGADRVTITETGNVGIGTTTPENLLQVARLSAGGNRAALQVTSPGDNSWGHVALLRTTGVGPDGARLLFHSRGIKNWSIGGQENTNNFGIWEDGGDGVYGSGFGTQRLRIEPGGAIFGKFRHVTFHSYNNSSYRGPNTTAETNWLPAPGGDGADDCWDCNLTANGTGYRRGWNAPYNGRLVKIIIRIYGDSGSNPDIQGVVRLHVNGTNFTDTNVFAINDSGVQTITLPTTGFSFNAGDRLALGLHKRGNNSDRFEDLDILVTAVWEYDIWD